MKKYKLYDYYEWKMELLGKFDNENEVAKACIQREADTDTECCFILTIYTNSNDLNIYQKIYNWTYTKNTLNFI